MKFPNGSVITPDGSTLIVAETLGLRLTAFDIAADGTLSNRRLWADLGARPPDGICLDAEGHVWVANPLAPECFLVAEGGHVLDVVETDQPCFACMLGGPERRHLFMMTCPSSDPAIASGATRGPRDGGRGGRAGRRPAVILHLLPRREWEEVQGDEQYLPDTFAADGFVHCSGDDDVLLAVANRFYAASRRRTGRPHHRRASAERRGPLGGGRPRAAPGRRPGDTVPPRATGRSSSAPSPTCACSGGMRGGRFAGYEPID